MPRYLIERSFPDGLSIPMNEDGRKAVAVVVANNTEHGVTWVRSPVFVSDCSSTCMKFRDWGGA